MAPLSHDEAQASIYRGCARLAVAMRVNLDYNNLEMVQIWEEEVLREARAVLATALDGPLTDLIIPPLPLAVIEVQKGQSKKRPLRPCDIHSPFEQASTSPWSVWMSREDDPEIPEDVDPGDVSTFWWTDLEERARTKRAAGKFKSDGVAGNVDGPIKIKEERCKEECNLISDSLMRRTPRNDAGKEEHALSVGRSASRPSKRSRADSQSDNEKRGDYIYVPKCNHCEERGWVCYVACAQDSGLPVGGARCLPCKYKKCRCSAISNPDIHRLVKNVGAVCAGSIPAKKKLVTSEKSIINMLRSQTAMKAKEEQAKKTVSESNDPRSTTAIPSGSCAPPSAKRQRVFVAVPSATFKAAAGAVNDSDVSQPQGTRIGPPGGKWKQEKRAELEVAQMEASESTIDAPLLPFLEITPTVKTAQTETSKSTTGAPPSPFLGSTPTAKTAQMETSKSTTDVPPLPSFESTPTAKASVSVGTITSPRPTPTPEINDRIPVQCPSRVLVDKGVVTEEQPLRQQSSDHQVEFLKGLMTIIQAAIQMYESRP